MIDTKNRRIEGLETNGCALISMMLSSGIAVLRRYKQVFAYVDASPVRPSASQAGSSSAPGEAADEAVYPHPLNGDLMVPKSKLRWPLAYLLGGNMYGHSPPQDLLLPGHLATSATSDCRRLALL